MSSLCQYHWFKGNTNAHDTCYNIYCHKRVYHSIPAEVEQFHPVSGFSVTRRSRLEPSVVGHLQQGAQTTPHLRLHQEWILCH